MVIRVLVVIRELAVIEVRDGEGDGDNNRYMGRGWRRLSWRLELTSYKLQRTVQW